MAITVKIPSQLRAATGGEGELEVEGGTVGEALDAVFDQHDGLRERITQDGDLRRFVNVYVSGEDIRFQDGLETQINDGLRRGLRPARRPPRAHHPGRRPAPLRQRLRLGRGHPLPGRPRDAINDGDEVTILPAVAGG